MTFMTSSTAPGVQMLIFLAGLQSISPAIYESCYMEGASAWETFLEDHFPDDQPDDSGQYHLHDYRFVYVSG